MISVATKVIIIFTLPLIPLILARGIRLDRVLFSVYLLGVLTCAYLLNQAPDPQRLHLFFLLTTVNLLVINLFFASQWGLRNLLKTRQLKITTGLLLPFPVALVVLFSLNYAPTIVTQGIYFAHPPAAPVTLLSAALSLLLLTMSWERLERLRKPGRGERLFRLGLMLWWIALLFLLVRMVYTGDAISIALFQLLFFAHLLGCTGIYLLIFKGTFLAVKAHPSPQLVGRATESLLVLTIITLFFVFEALGQQWNIPPYSITLLAVLLLTVVLLFPLLSFRPFNALQRLVYHHLYLPEQDFALEVSFYLKVMRGEESIEVITDHLRDRLNTDAVVLYRAIKGTHFILYQASPNSKAFPAHLSVPPKRGALISELPATQVLHLQARGETVGCLLLLGEKSAFSLEEESLLRFWSSTLGLLLKEVDLRQNEKEQEKLLHFSQATSFLLHDAKNLAQLLDLLLKNGRRLNDEDLPEFFNESLPALEQARSRARRILEKLETFQPPTRPIAKNVDLRSLLEETIKSLKISMKKDAIFFKTVNPKAPWKGDPQTLKTVIENLVLNALQAQGMPDSVTVVLKGDEKGYHIQVEDYGKGIADITRKKIFEPFFTTKQGGSGLGLYQARILVQKLGGKIWFEPNQPQGSVFHVSLAQHTYC